MRDATGLAAFDFEAARYISLLCICCGLQFALRFTLHVHFHVSPIFPSMLKLGIKICIAYMLTSSFPLRPFSCAQHTLGLSHSVIAMANDTYTRHTESCDVILLSLYLVSASHMYNACSVPTFSSTSNDVPFKLVEKPDTHKNLQAQIRLSRESAVC